MNAYVSQQIRERSKAARERVNKRWSRVRSEQAALEAVEMADPLRMPFRILQRVIVIDDGVTAQEIIR